MKEVGWMGWRWRGGNEVIEGVGLVKTPKCAQALPKPAYNIDK